MGQPFRLEAEHRLLRSLAATGEPDPVRVKKQGVVLGARRLACRHRRGCGPPFAVAGCAQAQPFNRLGGRNDRATPSPGLARSREVVAARATDPRSSRRPSPTVVLGMRSEFPRCRKGSAREHTKKERGTAETCPAVLESPSEPVRFDPLCAFRQARTARRAAWRTSSRCDRAMDGSVPPPVPRPSRSEPDFQAATAVAASR